MEASRAVEILDRQLAGLRALRADTDSVEFKTWHKSTEMALRTITGDDHPLVGDFLQHADFWSAYGEGFERGRKSSIAILEAAKFRLTVLAPPTEYATGAAIDSDLWEHVHRLVSEEEWAQVASQSAIFVESRLRQWAGRPAGEVGPALMTSVFRPEAGEFPLGQTPGEREGWHQLARGFAAAVRNVDTHRIQDRSDIKAYAIGALGTGSLLLTQVRFEHGNRLRKP